MQRALNKLGFKKELQGVDMAKVSVIMGSKSDLPVMQNCLDILEEFGVSYEVKTLSAHRMPEATAEYVKKAKDNGISVIIAAAGLAAHLPGVVASHTELPVIGVPMDSKPLSGMDALLSIVQMPGGVPVGCMAIGKAGAKNAALYAVQILAVSDEALGKRFVEYKASMAKGTSK